MDPVTLQQRLQEISTIWPLLHQAHQGESADRTLAQAELLHRYQRAVYCYLLQAVEQVPDRADDLFQEFALRFIRGDFHHADRQRGRFRDYLKTSLDHLIVNYLKRQGRDRQLRQSLDSVLDIPAEEQDLPFLHLWCQELLDRAWESLAAVQSEDGPPFYAVLRQRFEHPELTAADLAERFTTQLQPSRPFTEAGIRKTLQRAREQFAEFLIAEVKRTLPTPSRADLEKELGELGFLPYCHKALEQDAG
jgi:RNA polymerase sigma-70 factor (ECF subfamily)